MLALTAYGGVLPLGQKLTIMRPKNPPLKIGSDIASAKTVFLRVPPELHAALVVAAGAEQQKRGEKVSINWLAAKVLAEAMGFEVAK
jgi:hypothetical protein